MPKTFIQVCSGTMVVLGLLVLIGAGERNTVAVSELQSMQIVGTLGRPLGTFLVIEGAPPALPTMNPTGSLIVDTVDGKKLVEPITIELHNRNDLEAGERYRLRGFENGGMGGRPKDPEAKNDHGSQAPFRFAVWFEVSQDAH